MDLMGLLWDFIVANLAFIAALVPVAVLLVMIYRMDKVDREPIGKLVLTFFMGCIVVFPAVGQESMLMTIYTLITSGAHGLLNSFSDVDVDSMVEAGNPVVGALYNGYVVAGLTEELWKLLFLYWVVWRSPHFDEYFDGIVYAVFISMGFAAVENLSYVMFNDSPLLVAGLRALLAVPAHFLFAVSMGYYFSLAKFDPSRKRRYLTLALIVPMLLHGTYDSLLMLSDALDEGNEWIAGLIIMVFLVFDVLLWILGVRRIRRMQQRSREQDFDRLNPFDNFSWHLPE